jgi:hypothetical protein
MKENAGRKGMPAEPARLIDILFYERERRTEGHANKQTGKADSSSQQSLESPMSQGLSPRRVHERNGQHSLERCFFMREKASRQDGIAVRDILFRERKKRQHK